MEKFIIADDQFLQILLKKKKLLKNFTNTDLLMDIIDNEILLEDGIIELQTFLKTDLMQYLERI